MKIPYIEGDTLEEDQYLLKIHPNYWKEDIGYLTKMNKNGTVPKAFKNWNWSEYNPSPSPIQTFVFDEYFRPGWQIVKHREGASQTWCVVRHPEGFLLEIYLVNLFELLSKDVLVKGALGGEYKWKNNRLISKDDETNSQTK
jgi:hypothetical protein